MDCSVASHISTSVIGDNVRMLAGRRLAEASGGARGRARIETLRGPEFAPNPPDPRVSFVGRGQAGLLKVSGNENARTHRVEGKISSFGEDGQLMGVITARVSKL